MLDPDISKTLPQQSIVSVLGIEPTEKEIATAMKARANVKATGPDGLPVELLKLGLQQGRITLLELHWLTTLIWYEGNISQQWEGAVITVLRKTGRRSADTIAISSSCHTRVRCSLKWLPGGLVITVRPGNCYRRSSVDFGRIVRPRT